ncbi:MAG: hypothetical protein K2J80_02630, partial [Oscillospiraceae bacterium]|nr:hypothetical protein [Oscillospiraceae bacterium]
MKIGDASRIYSEQMSRLREKRSELLEKKKALENGEIEMTDEEVTSLGKSLDRVDIQYEKASEFMQGFNMQKTLLHNAEASKRTGDAMAEKAENDAKCIEIARRIARGDKVPPKDEQKLLEFNSDMYQMAKNMAAMAKNEKPKEHDSLWDDEDENQQPEQSVDEVVDNMECGMTMPPEISADIDMGIE